MTWYAFKSKTALDNIRTSPSYSSLQYSNDYSKKFPDSHHSSDIVFLNCIFIVLINFIDLNFFYLYKYVNHNDRSKL